MSLLLFLKVSISPVLHFIYMYFLFLFIGRRGNSLFPVCNINSKLNQTKSLRFKRENKDSVVL